MAAVTICSDFGAQENKVFHWFHCFSIYLPWSDGTRCHNLNFLSIDVYQIFHSPLLPLSRGPLVPLCFLPLGWWHPHIWGYWYFSGNLDSNLWFFRSVILHLMYSAFKLNNKGDNKQPWYSFPNLEPVHCSMSSSNCCFLICIQDFQEAGKVVWYSHLSKNLPQFAVILTVRGLV